MNLSILIPARNEIYLARTVKSLLDNIRGKTEILVGLDGEWADPPLEDDPRVTILYHNKSVGQRAITNNLCKLSKAKWVMKIDAHCMVDEGFDVKMMEAMQDDWTMIPALYNLHAFNWECNKCGNVWYQAPTPTYCNNPGEKRGRNEKCDNTTDFKKVMVWDRRKSRRSEHYRFDTNLKFTYHGIRKKHPESVGDIVETMSAQGSCFMLTRDKYWELDICDEEFGSWGQQGTEVACKTWLSGGRLVTNKKTWYAHLFRTQGGDFGFPFPLSGSQVSHARKFSQDLFLDNKWDKQVKPLSWLLEKFKPLPDWHDGNDNGKLAHVINAGKQFEKRSKGLSKGIIFYTDNQLSLKIAHRVQKQLKSIGLPIVSASLKPMNLGSNVVIPRKRGVLTMFIQILTALENSTTDIVFFCEHDVIYHSSHFDFNPEKKDRFYYNEYFWKVDSESGKALHYKAKQVSGICVYRETAIKHYRKRVEMVKKDGYSMRMGYEPGTHNRKERVDDLTSEGWMSKYPNIDIRHGSNLSPTRWKKEQFRNQKYTKGWKEGTSKDIPGWDGIAFT